MTSRVRLNVPPRVIESARAAQHANREALSARQAAERIRSKAEQQQAAERRAQGLRAPTAGTTAQQRQIDGGQLEFTRRKGQRIWTRRRAVGEVDVVTGWYYLRSPSTAESNPPGDVVSSSSTYTDWEPPLNSIEPPPYISTSSGSSFTVGAHRLRFDIGSGDGGSWVSDETLIPWSRSSAVNGREIYNTRSLTTRIIESSSDQAHDRCFAYVTALLPLGGNRAIWCVAVAQFRIQSHSEFRANDFFNDFGGNYSLGTIQVTASVPVFRSFLVSASLVQPLNQPVPGFILRQVESLRNSLETRSISPVPDSLGEFEFLNSIGINGQGLLNGQRSSSAIFDSLASYNQTGVFTASVVQAVASYQVFSGSSEIPVLGYRLIGRAQPYPVNERGVFGVIPGASVTNNQGLTVTTALVDEVELAPTANATAPGGPHRMLLAYDYHGGSYCRDKLRELGINL